MVTCFPCLVLFGIIVGVTVIIPTLRTSIRNAIARSVSRFSKTVETALHFVMRYRLELIILAVGFGAMNTIFIAAAFRGDTVNQTSAGQLGDFVGGYIGTLFALVSVLLLYRTLRNQRELSELTGFETKFYELLKLHRENVTEMRIGEIVGRRIFVMMIAELRKVYESVCSFDCLDRPWKTEERWHIAYYFFYFGVGPTSTPMVKHALADYGELVVDEIASLLELLRRNNHELRLVGIEYPAFDGHQSRLGHYYRHLYQAVDYVNSRSFLSEKQKKSYVRTMRAQLSTHEQALLLINSLTPFGTKWWDENLIQNYALVKNLPPGFFDEAAEIDAILYFKPGYFEVDELQKRPKSRLLPSQ